MRVKRNKKNAAELAAANERHIKNLREPDYASFVKCYGCQPPTVLRQLYENPESNLEGDFEVKIAPFPNPFFIADFVVMNKERMSFELSGTDRYFPFVQDNCGNLYIVGPRETDPIVHFLDHELNGPESLKVSLSQFLAIKRTKSRW